MKDKEKVKALDDEEENRIDLTNKSFISSQERKLNKLEIAGDQDFEKDEEDSLKKYNKKIERRQNLYNAILRQTGTKPPFKSYVESDKEYDTNPSSGTYGQLNNRNRHFYFHENKPGINSNVNHEGYNNAIDNNLYQSWKTAKEIKNYVDDHKQYTKTNDEIKTRIKDSQKVAKSQQKLDDHRKANEDTLYDNPKYLTKTLSTTQRAKEHLQNNYDNLVRLIEARKKKWN